MSQTIKVKFKKIDNTECELELPVDLPVEELREMLAKHEKIKVPADQMRILYRAKLLKDGHKLNEYVTEDGQTIHVIQRPTQAQMNQVDAQSQSQSNPQPQPQANAAGPRMGGPPPGMPPMMGGLFSQFMAGPPGAQGPGGAPPQMPPMPNLQNLLNSIARPPQAAGGPPRPGNAPGQSGSAGSGDAEAADEMVNNMLGAIGDAASMISTQIRERQAQRVRQQPPAQPQPANQPAQPQPQQPQAPPSSSQAPNAAGGNTHVMQLPHQVLVRIGQVCNHMQGPGASFPGPPMPQLQVERNTVVLLGSYLTNLNLQLQRLAPMMSRTGDLMQRESLLTTQAERQLTQQMANDLGQALEDIARATGSVAHFYKTLEMGQTGAQCRLNVRGFEPSFQGIVDEVQSVRTVPRAGGQQERPAQGQADAEMRSALIDHEEEKQPDVDFDRMPNPLKEFGEVITPQDMSKIFLGLGDDQLNHLPSKIYDFVQKKKQDYNGSLQRYAEHITTTILRELSNDAVRDQIHPGFDPIISLQDPLKEKIVLLCTLILQRDPQSSWSTFTEPIKPAATRAVGEIIDELKDGFQTGEEGVFAWVQSNAMNYYMKTLPPEQKMQAMMKVGPMIFLLRNQYTKYQQNRAAGLYNQPSQQPGQQPQQPPPVINPPQDAVMQDEAKKAEPKQQPPSGGEVPQPEPFTALSSASDSSQQQEPPANMALLARFKDILHGDKQKIKNADEQMPHSRAYMATCSITRSNQLPLSEERLLQKEYKAGRDKALRDLNAEQIVRDKIRKNLITGAGYPQAKVEEQLAKVEEVPEELVEAYVKMQRNLIKFRLACDDDYKRSKHPDAPNDSKQFENLNNF